jgi:hypothetical protein
LGARPRDLFQAGAAVTLSIGIRTVTRLELYLQHTLQRLSEVTKGSTFVQNVHVSYGDGLEPNENALRALSFALADGTDWVLLLEDDLEFIDDFAGSLQRWLDKFVIPTVHFYPLGCFYPSAIQAARQDGMWEQPLLGYYGSQAVVFRAADAQALIEWFPSRPTLKADSGWDYPRDRCFDLYLAAWHRHFEPTRDTVRTPAPCFIDHVGTTSAISHREHHGAGRVDGFGGRSFSFNG